MNKTNELTFNDSAMITVPAVPLKAAERAMRILEMFDNPELMLIGHCAERDNSDFHLELKNKRHS